MGTLRKAALAMVAVAALAPTAAAARPGQTPSPPAAGEKELFPELRGQSSGETESPSLARRWLSALTSSGSSSTKQAGEPRVGAGPRGQAVSPSRGSKPRAKSKEAEGPPIDAAARAAIAREDVLAQMAFWAREHELHPNDPEAVQSFVEALRKGGRHERAVEVAAVALQQHKRDPRLLRGLGAALLALGRGGEAVGPLSALIAHSPDDVRAWDALGVAYDQAGRAKQARDAYQRALTLAPDDARALTNLGVSWLLAGEPAKAEDALRRASVLTDAPVESRQNLALAVGLQGRFDEAEALWKQDLPAAMAANNLAYVRAMLTDERRWGDLKRDLGR